MNEIINSIRLTKTEKKAFIYIFIVSMLSLASLIQANVLYVDDISRTIETGNAANWQDNGRPLSSVMYLILQLGLPLTDISPLTQILSVAIYSLTSVYLGKIFLINDLWFLVLSGIIFVLNPFNLENFSYIFESLMFAVAAFSSTMAFVLITVYLREKLTTKIKLLSFVFSVLCLLISLCFYQASISIYLAIFSFYSLFKLGETLHIKQSLKIFFSSSIVLFFSLLAYAPIKHIFVKGEYNITHSKTASFINIPKTVINNLLLSLQNINQWLEGILKLLIILILVITIISLLIMLFRNIYLERNKLNGIKIISILLLMVGYSCIFIISLAGLMVLLENPVIWPRAFMGFAGIVCICSLFLSYIFSNIKTLKYFLIFLLSLFCLSFTNVSLTLGNVLNFQNNYEEMMATVLLSDLEESISKIPNPPENPKIAIGSPLEYSPLTIAAFNKYPILKQITWSYFIPNRHQGYKKFYSLGFKFSETPEIEQPFIPKTQPIITRRIYDVYLENNDTFVVTFK